MRRNIKKLTATLLITTLALSSFTGCGKSKDTASNNNDSSAVTEQTTKNSEPATNTSEMSVTTLDENGNEITLTGTAVTDADGNVTLTTTDENGNTVEITGKSAIDDNGNTVIEKPAMKSDDGTMKDIEDTQVIDIIVITPTDNNNDNNNQPAQSSASTPATPPTTAPTESTQSSHTHTWNPIYGYRQVDEYGDVPVYAVVKRMNGYPFEILACDKLGISRDANQLYLDWHVGENQMMVDIWTAKYMNGELTMEQVLELANNPDNYPYPETYNYTDPRANRTGPEQIGTEQGVIGSKMEQYIDHYECDGYGWLCDGYLTVDQYNASH